MITLDLPPHQQAILARESERAGMSMQQYVLALIEQHTSPSTPQSKANGMVERIKQMPKPTSYDPAKSVNIQQELRNEWH